MSTIYDNKVYLENNPLWHEEDSSWKASKVDVILKRNNINPETVAEIGCGAGGILLSLSQLYPKTVFDGFDISSDIIPVAQKKQNDKLHFHLEDLTKSTKTFDVLLMMDVFEHVPDYMGFIKSCKERSTYKVFHVPLDLSLQKLLRPQSILHNRYHTGHLHYFSRETALATIKDCGYEIIDTEMTRWGLEMDQKGLMKKLGKIPLYLLDKISPTLAARILGGNSILVLTK